MFEQRSEIYCIEHSLSADDSLAFILDHHQTQRGWNAFVRIRLALRGWVGSGTAWVKTYVQPRRADVTATIEGRVADMAATRQADRLFL
jgi:hypothetical protein